MKKIFALGLVTVTALAVTACGRLSDEDNIWNVRRPTEPTAATVVASATNFNPGVFHGTGAGGFNGDVSVAVTIDNNGTITHIEVTDHQETPSYANHAFDQNIPAVLAAQSYQVDTVSGATRSSTAFLAAVEDALSQAEARLTPGVFHGIGEGGFNGNITVAVTVDDAGTIAHIEVTDHQETPSYANHAFDQNIPAVLAAQSYQVDTVSGATRSSTAFLAAVEDALTQAQN